jgi:hypothetical protein
MKKIFVILVTSLVTAFSSNALANHDLHLLGTISSVNKETKVIVVKNTEDDKEVSVIITPATDLEFKHKLISWAKFKDLEEGQFVEVEYLPNSNKKIIAKEVEICAQDND